MATCAFVFGVAALPAARAEAAGTDPTLALQSARVVETSAGSVAVELTGSFHFDDVVQLSFPAGLFVSRGSSWVRFGLDGAVSAGTSTAVANGISAAEVPALLSSGAPAAAPAAVLRVAPDRIVVALPEGFASGPARVVLYAVLEGDAFVSNDLQVTVP